MKFLLLLLSIPLGFVSLLAQKENFSSKLSEGFPAPTGIYKEIMAKSAAALSTNKPKDTLTFDRKRYRSDILLIPLIRPYYMTANEEIELMNAVLLPPANSSQRTQFELSYLLSIQANRNVSDSLFCYKMAYIDIDILPVGRAGFRSQSAYDSVLNTNNENLFYTGKAAIPNFNANNYPETAKLLLNAVRDIQILLFASKERFMRPRPYDLDSNIRPLNNKRIPHAAYPSGHTGTIYVIAYILSELSPENTEVFTSFGQQMAYSRELFGIHYPSDNETARQMAYTYLKAMQKNPKFNADFERAKKEFMRNKNKASK